MLLLIVICTGEVALIQNSLYKAVMYKKCVFLGVGLFVFFSTLGPVVQMLVNLTCGFDNITKPDIK